MPGHCASEILGGRAGPGMLLAPASVPQGQGPADQHGLLAAEARRQQGTGHRERPQAAAIGLEGQDDLGMRTIKDDGFQVEGTAPRLADLKNAFREAASPSSGTSGSA